MVGSGVGSVCRMFGVGWTAICGCDCVGLDVDLF